MDHDLPIHDHVVPPADATPNPTRRSVLPLVGTTLAALAAGKLPAQAKPATSSADVGTIWWSELRTRDPERARAFYAGVIGWIPKMVAQDDMARPPAPGEKGYTLFMMRGQEVAGAEQIEPDDLTGLRQGWSTYVQVDDVDETLRKVATLGGKTTQQAVDVPGVGRFAVIEDPEGNRLGLVSPRT